MSVMSKPGRQGERLHRGFSRRDLARVAALAAGAAGLIPFWDEPSLAQLSALPGPIPSDAVKIDANENPMGPCPEAIEAVRAMAVNGGRYLYGQTNTFCETLAQVEGVQPDYVKAYPGSSLPIHHAVIAFTSPQRPLVTADPGYEAPERAADFIGAKVIRAPLTGPDCAHDVKAMLAAAASSNAGLIYVCNPNNPTGTLTPRAQIEWLIANKPRDCVVLLDEAYIHLADVPRCSDLVAQGKDLILLRTFSKLYGMAGLRAGAALARPDLLEKLGQYYTGALPTTAMAAATASLKVPGLVEQRRKIIADVRDDVLRFIKLRGFSVTPAASNCFMVDAKRPGHEVVAAFRREKIYIGRVWPSWPTWVRVTVGTAPEMERFKAAFAKVVG
jgi:histidinol-phosphate aminotransferase